VKPTNKSLVKICCIQSIEEAKFAISSGAAAIGLVSEMPSGPGPIPDGLIATIAATIPPGIPTFLLTSKRDVASIVAQQRRTNVNTIQIVDEFPIDQYRSLRDQLPGIKLVQVVHVLDEGSIEQSVRVSNHVDAVLLDSGNPTLAIKELGGTGRVHNWTLSRQIRDMLEIPVYLAGGMNSENVGEAIRTVGPFAVDVCSGVRSNGKLDKEKLTRFFAEVRKGWTAV
jgi:phosphoribosylanthranilate isomerase